MSPVRRPWYTLAAILVALSFWTTAYAGQRFSVHRRGERATLKFAAGEVLVRFKVGTPKAAIAAVYRRHGTTEISTSRAGGFKRIRIRKGKTIAQVVVALRKEPTVKDAKRNSICYAAAFPDDPPNDPYYPDQWHLDDRSSPNPNGGANGGGINLEPAWKVTQGAGVIVAVLDTGVAYENYGAFTRAPDLASTTFVKPYDAVEKDGHPNDDNSHGTHVTGTIAQSTNNGVGVAGVAFACSIMPVKVLDANGEGTAADLADGIRYAADNGAKVINLSLSWPLVKGKPYNPGWPVDEAIAYAFGKGVIIVCSSGNDGKGAVAYPAAYDDYCIAVGATRYDETRPRYSNYGSSLDLVAPGGDVGRDQNGDGYGDGVLQNTFNPNTRNPSDFGYWFFDGTSMAAPHVSGVAALIIASGVVGSAPSPGQVRQRLVETAEDKGAPGWDARYGHGLVDAGKAVVSQNVITIDSVQATPASVPKYARVELLVSLFKVVATKFHEPDPAYGGLDLSATFTGPGGTFHVPGFHDGTNWLVRFAPGAVGTWSYSVTAKDSSGTSNTVGGSFACVASSHLGWVRIDGRYLRRVTGEVFFAVGHNNGWQTDAEQPSLADMASKGENLLSFWIAAPWYKPSEGAEWAARAPVENAEGGIGNYNQAACAYIDGVVARAEAAGVSLLPTIWSHGQLRDTGHPWGAGWWDNNAYKGTCSAADFFKTSDGGADTPQWRLQKNFYRYLLARWGYSRAIAGWVGLCEIDGTTGYVSNRAQAEAWCAAVRDYFRANDPYRANAGGATPVAFTKVNAPGWGNGDLRATDNYAQQTNDIEVAAAIGADTETMWGSGKPGFHAEFGGDTINGATQPTHLHNGIWAGASAGAAMTPLVWCDGGNWPMLTDPEVGGPMRDHLQSLSQFVAGISYQGDSALSPADVSVTGGRRGWGMKLADRGYSWIQNPSGTMGGQTLSVPAFAEGGYEVRWYDVWSSGETSTHVSSVTVRADGVLTVAIPVLARGDIACKILRVSSPPTYSVSGTITEQGTGLPLAGVTVELAGGQATKTTQTAADGTYSFSDLEPGSYTVTPALAGYAFTPPPQQVEVVNADVGGVDFTGQQQSHVNIHGWITNSSTGSVVAGVTVRLEQKIKRWSLVTTATTNAEGYYQFVDVATPKTYRVVPDSSQYRFTPRSYEVTINSPNDQVICDFVAKPRK